MEWQNFCRQRDAFPRCQAELDIVIALPRPE